MARYDVAILGTGPAGLEAAITLKIRNKSILLLGERGSSEKVAKAHTILNYLGLPSVAGEEMQSAFLNHLKEMGVEITEDRITLVYPMGDYFALQGKNNEIYEASSVILACGVTAGKPYPGENEYLGRGVSYCATCDAALYRGKTVAVVGSSPKEEVEADFLTEYAAKVYYFPLYKAEPQVKESVEVIREIPREIHGKMKVTALVTDQKEYPVDGIFILRESISPANLLPGLEMDDPHVKTDRQMKTNVAGCFACGDITGRPYQYIKSAGEGNVAALSAAAYLDEKRRQV